MCIIKFRLSFIKIAQLSIVYLHKLFGSFSIDRRFINEGIKHQYGVSICWLSTKSELLSFFFELIVCRTTFEAQHDRARILPLIPPYTRPYTGLHKTIQFSWHTFQAVLSLNSANQPAVQLFLQGFQCIVDKCCNRLLLQPLVASSTRIRSESAKLSSYT